MAATASTVDQAASAGFSNAAAYDEHRPSYPAHAVDGFLDMLGVAPPARVVDLAAGTGKFTEVLAASTAAGGARFEVRAVEPVAAMADALVAKRLPGVTVAHGLATDMNVPDGWADAVVAAQSFHWFANEKALEEIHRVLKPGGKLGMIWNIEDCSPLPTENQPKKWTAATRWGEQLKELCLGIEAAGPPRFRDDIWWHVFERQSHAAKPIFSTPVGEKRLPFAVWLTKDRLWDRVNTLSYVVTLQGERKEAFRARFDDILKDGDGNWNANDEIEFHGTTVYAWTTKL